MKTFAEFEYRPPAVQSRPVHSVFVDLDETLIHSIGRPKANRVQVRLAGTNGDRDEVYSVFVRPAAHSILAGLRAVAPSVKMLTNARRAYAEAMNSRFRFGFRADEIIARENYTFEVGRTEYPMSLTTFPGSVLIDNEPPTAPNAAVKRAFLGPSLFIQIRAYDGRPDSETFVDGILALFRVVSDSAAGKR